MSSIKNILLVLPVMFVFACANISPNVYRAGSVGQMNRTSRGVVVAARPVTVVGNDNNTRIGAPVGAVLGGLAAYQVGAGSHAKTAAALTGALAGGIVGDQLEQQFSSQSAIEYVVRTDNGKLVNIVQGADVVLGVGQEVYIFHGNPSRIVPASGGNYYSQQQQGYYAPQPQQQGYYTQQQVVNPYGQQQYQQTAPQTSYFQYQP